MENNKKCKCGFCESELQNSCLEPKFCSPCTVEFVKCDKCELMYEKHLEKCPQCGNLNTKIGSN